MPNLVIRHSQEDQCLRSLGDAPNGIVGIMFGEGSASWIVDPHWTPRPDRKGTEVETLYPHQHGPVLERTTEVEIADVVDGCARLEDLVELDNALVDVAEAAVRPAAGKGDFDSLEALLRLMRETLERSVERMKAEGWGPFA